MTKRLKYLVILVAMLVCGQAVHAAEASPRIQNYDRWKDLPTKTLGVVGDQYWRYDKVDSALVCFFIMANRYNDDMPSAEKLQCAAAYEAIGKIYIYYFCDYQDGYRYLLKAKEITTKNDFKIPFAAVSSTLAGLQANRIDVESNYSFRPELLDLFKDAFYKAVKNGHYRSAIFDFGNLAYVAMKHQHIKDIDSEIQAFRKLNIPDSIIFKPYFQELCEAVLAYSEGKHQQALDLLSHAEDVLPQNESFHSVARSLSMNKVFKYVVLLSLNRDAEALQELDHAEEIINEYHINDAIAEILHIKQEYYATHGNAALAKEYELKYFKAKDEFINHSKMLSAEQQQFLIDFEEMGDQVKDLKAQKRIRDLVILGIGIFAVLAIGILLFLWRNYQQTKQRNVLLFKKNQELLSLEAQVREHKSEVPHEPSKYKSSPMDEPAKAELLQQLQEIMESHQEVFEEGFTLDQLARLADSNRNYVSQVINEMMGCNFNTFVNEYRIKEACRRLSDTANFGGLTIEAVGQSVGFKSRTNFAATFKKFTGMTPAAYQRLANPSNA